MSNNVLITGASGQLGRELSGLIENAIGVDVDELDITNFEAVLSLVRGKKIDTIVNCAAYTAVDKAEDEADKAYMVNVAGPENLARTGCRIVHISTDYVFDGKNYRPYTPDDLPNPLSVYGRTKYDGEKKVLEIAKQAVVIRTSWLYSAGGSNFVKTVEWYLP